MQLCLVGGTFDPPHWGHILLAETLYTQIPVEQVMFVPAAIPPHKRHETISTAEHRVRMLELICRQNTHFQVDSREIERSGISYSIETVRAVKKEKALERDDLGFLIGTDNFADLQNWKEAEQLVRACRILVMPRLHYPFPDEAPFRDQVESVDLPIVEISSSTIRQRVRQGLSIRYYVLPEIERYIAEHALYQHRD
ncbi:MAG TPA: nicotinate (nicotinamide) nucleotide adenylyltransferase [bacterium]|nr:nicotinate (nicotinamide) nucleotide adenylyltransferase [bacterium]